MENNTIKTAIIGYGKGGSIYNAPIIKSVPGFSIAKILTSNSENIKAAKKDFPAAEVVQDYEKISEDPEIELVIISLPNHLHFEFAKKALLAHKNVVVEKPFTTTVKEAEELILLAKKQQKIISVNHNRRWDSDFRTIKKLISNHNMGEIVEFEAHFDRFRPEIKTGWKENKEIPGNDILYDLGSHLIDQALLLFGKPTEIFADLRIQRESSEVIDNFELLLFYNTLKVTLKAGMLVQGNEPRFRIYGRKGSFIKWGTDVQEEALKNVKNPGNTEKWGREPKNIWGKLSTSEEEILVESVPGNYRKFYENIFGAIRKKESLQVHPEEAKNVIKIIELAYQSQKERKVIACKD